MNARQAGRPGAPGSVWRSKTQGIAGRHALLGLSEPQTLTFASSTPWTSLWPATAYHRLLRTFVRQSTLRSAPAICMANFFCLGERGGARDDAVTGPVRRNTPCCSVSWSFPVARHGRGAQIRHLAVDGCCAGADTQGVHDSVGAAIVWWSLNFFN